MSNPEHTNRVAIFDTTLRDGTQGESVQISVQDKITIAQLLDDLGISYIEGGWPASSPRDKEFFEASKGLKLRQAKLTAFGATRRHNTTCDEDRSIQALLQTGLACLTVFGKTWTFQATRALRISPEQNLELIDDTIRYLKSRVDELVFDAEHFFDGYVDDPEYALKAIATAQAAGADSIVLCDTNGGMLPSQIENAIEGVRNSIFKPLGIHAHNDGEMAVANSIRAVQAGVSMVQGAINGYGERCGNANLISIIPALVLKMGIECIPKDQLAMLTHVSRMVDELSNRSPNASQPYVGRSAFAHKGGVHANAIRKDSRTYEHIDPALVGNQRRVLVSDLSGRDNVCLKASEFGIELDPKAPETQKILDRLKQMENYGYQFEAASASFKLVIDEAFGRRPNYFRLLGLDVSIGLNGEREEGGLWKGESIARITVEVGGVEAKTSARGEGPVHAMDLGLRRLIDKFYPALNSVRLLDYKVRVLSSKDGTGSVVRVLLQSSDGDEVWGTVGVSPNIIAASWHAMVDGLEYKLVKDQITPHMPEPETVAPSLRPAFGSGASKIGEKRGKRV
ncbi:MAG: citramalate synthase [Deltaproteobacteria bacterium]|nr:citramalate synthase [Deltaproteobacteria bacterium]